MRSFQPRRAFLAALVAANALLGLAGCPKPKPIVAQCKSNADCSGGDVCASGVCAPPAVPQCDGQQVCHADSDCPSGQCTGEGCCLAVCTNSSSCTDTQECVNNVCQDIGAGCSSNAGCPHSTASICDVDAGACVECLANNQCPPGSLCQNEACSTSTVTCTSDSECTLAELPHCDTTFTGGRCVACTTSSQCPSGDSCTDDSCLEPNVGCVFNGDCTNNPNGAYCAPNNTCVACVENDDCPPGSACLPNDTCQAETACVSDANCPTATPHCRPSDHFCAECAINSQCPTGQVCNNGYCLPPVNGCLSNAQCVPPLATCDTTTRTCIGCQTDADCGAFCVNGMCQPCTQDLDCQEAFLTQGRIYCNSAKACVVCVGTVQCESGQVCNSAGNCVPDPTDGPCPATGGCGMNAAGDALQCVNGICRLPCDPYDPMCNSGDICGVTGYAAGLPQGTCAPPAAGAAAVGGACSASTPCEADAICLPVSASASQCFAVCDPNSSNANCGPPSACKGVVELVSGNVPVSIGACVPSSKFTDACDVASDCSAGQVCVAEGDPFNPVTLANECWWPAGAGGPGAGCSHPNDCQSGLCIIAQPNVQNPTSQTYPGFCEGGCNGDASCPPRADGYAGACEKYPAPWYSQTGAADTTDVTTCVAQCRSDSECEAGLTCDVVADVANVAWVTRCVPTNTSSTSMGGADCLTDSDCFSNHCLSLGSGAGGICAGVCNPANGNADCNAGSTCPTGGVQLVLPGTNTYEPAPICWEKPCTANIQCGPAGFCDGDPAPNNPNDIVLYCGPIQGHGGGGATCAQNSDCKSGFCVEWANGNGCFGVCNTSNGNADCATGATCTTADWPGTTHVLSYCLP
jgi:Cys-rich repeat protein